MINRWMAVVLGAAVLAVPGTALAKGDPAKGHGKEKAEPRKIDMDDLIGTTPVFSNGVLYVTTHRTLYAIQQKKYAARLAARTGGYRHVCSTHGSAPAGPGRLAAGRGGRLAAVARTESRQANGTFLRRQHGQELTDCLSQ